MDARSRHGALLLGASACALLAQPAEAQERSFEIYGFAMLDYIQDFGRVNPQWEDTLRPSRIPTNPQEFGDEGMASLSVKQSRLGVQANVPTTGGDVFAKFEFDMFGVGGDAGETTIRLRHAYGQFGNFLAGQTNSLFMDGDIFPNTIDYWGPAGMVFLRNPQIRWMPGGPDGGFAIALENPGNDIDSGQFREVPDFPGAQGNQKYPDITAHYRTGGDRGHFQIAGIVRWIGAEVLGDVDPGPGTTTGVMFSDDATGWGVNLTGVRKLGERDALRAGVVVGEGIASYMNDGGMDAGPDRPPGTPGVQLEAVELTGVSLYYDHYWSDRWSTSLGYAFTEVDNLPGQTADTFKKGQYASLNLLHYPTENVMCGIEFLWGEREDFGGASNDDTRIQFSFKYDFSSKNF